MIRAHFVDIESHVVPLLIAQCPAREQAQDQDAMQAHCPLAATWSVSYSTLHNPCSKDGQFISSWETGVTVCPCLLDTTRDHVYVMWHKWRILCNVSTTPAEDFKMLRQNCETLCTTTMNFNVFHQFYQAFLTCIKWALPVFICLLWLVRENMKLHQPQMLFWESVCIFLKLQGFL